jgi:sn-glycerol 3-phosphate transport system permease protein
MVERRPVLTLLTHVLLLLGVMIVAFPVYLAWVASTHTAATIAQSNPLPLLPGGHGLENYALALWGGTGGSGSLYPAAWPMLGVSLASALIIALGKIFISLLSAFAIVYFRFPLRQVVFWMVFVTLMLPVEVRIGPTYQVVADLGLLNSYAGLTVPLIASATATFLFRQFFLTVPDELVEAARMDGASPMRFFRDVLLPLSATPMAALFVIQFIYGWNQYLWPLLVTTNEDMYPIVLGIKRLIAGEVYTDWNIVMAVTVLAMLPPAAVVIGMQKWFVKGLVDTEK